MGAENIRWRVNSAGRMEACGLIDESAATSVKERCCANCVFNGDPNALARGEDWALDMERESGWGNLPENGLCRLSYEAVDDVNVHKCADWKASE